MMCPPLYIHLFAVTTVTAVSDPDSFISLTSDGNLTIVPVTVDYSMEFDIFLTVSYLCADP